MGAALFTWHQLLDKPRHAAGHDIQKGSFLLVREISLDQIQDFLDKKGVEYIRVEDDKAHAEYVAQLLAQEKVVGWFHGRMEFGPRALGARSIIGDARSPKMQATMNLKIKFRESFRRVPRLSCRNTRTSGSPCAEARRAPICCSWPRFWNGTAWQYPGNNWGGCPTIPTSGSA